MGFGDASIPAKLSLLVLPLGSLFILIGVASPYWFTVPDDVVHIGLWRACISSICGSLDDVPGWLNASRAFAVLSILLGGVGFIFHVLSILKSDNRGLKNVAVGLIFASAIFAFVAVGIFGGEYESYTTPVEKSLIKLSWSLILTAVGGVIKIVGGVLLIVNIQMSS